MAVWQAEILLKTFRTNLSCKVLISYVSVENDALGLHFWWQKVAGAYNFGPTSGKWAYWRSGIILSRTNDMNNPLTKEKVNHLIVLNDIPVRFAEKVAPGSILTGTGYHFTTNEEVNWEMRFPTVPVKKG